MNRKEAHDIMTTLTEMQREAVALFVQTAPVLWDRDEATHAATQATLTQLANEIAGHVLPNIAWAYAKNIMDEWEKRQKAVDSATP